MARIIRIIVKGFRNVGMVDGMRSIFDTRPPISVPVVLSSEEAAATDADALASDWLHVSNDLERSYEKEIGLVHA